MNNARIIHTDEIIKNIKEMCIEANYYLSEDIEAGIKDAVKKEESVLGKQILGQLVDNMNIAKEEMIPICQDTGMAVIFIDIGQEVRIEGMYIEDAVNEGIRRGYEEGFLRKSVVSDPILRKNTDDNTPGILHYQIVPGDKIEITVAPKGFGSENMSRVIMLKPSDGREGIIKAVLDTIIDAGPNACPPIVVGIGIGGSFEKCAILSKKALTRNINMPSRLSHIMELEEELLNRINQTNIGPGGLGGTVTALAVNIETFPTHIAGLPLAVNICCHVNRHVTRKI